jgi:putative NIF3 family GTP cyclohydrolase 1 type 2
VGEKGRREEVQEYRLEVVCPADQLNEAIRRMRAAHSYEEPAFNVYPLQSGKGPTGTGRIGTLAQAESLQTFAQRVKSVLTAGTVQIVGAPERPVRRVAIACGAAGELLKDAIQAQADVFLTGELRFHDLLTAEAAGLSLVLPGHYATERPGVEELAGLLQREHPTLRVWASRREQEPLWRDE